jgi:membrane protease YdiL (CAAX protease family)
VEYLIAIFMLLMLAVSWALWTAAIVRWRYGEPPLAAEPRRPAPWGILDLIVAILLVLLIPLVAREVLHHTSDLLPSPKLEELTSPGRAALVILGSLSSVLALALTIVLVKVRVGATGRDLGVSADRAPRDLVTGLAAFFMLAPIVYAIMLVLVQWFKSEHPLIKLVKENPDPLFFTLSFFAAVIVAPVVEEFLFRVFLQGWLEKWAQWLVSPRHVPPVVSDPATPPPGMMNLERGMSVPLDPSNPYAPPATAKPETIVTAELADAPSATATPVKPPPFWPILVSSTIFALLHLGHGPDPIPLFALALGLGYLYRQTHRVLPGIVVHMLLNATSMVMLLFSIYGGVK